MATRYPLTATNTLTDRDVFFDANVLIYIYWPTADAYWQTKYSRAFAVLLRSDCRINIDYYTISEVINRIFKIEYTNYLVTNPGVRFKDYRNSDEGKETLSDIYTIVHDDILRNFKVVENVILSEDIKSLLVVEGLDFNDKCLAFLCQQKGFILLTNDGDFKSCDIDLLTANVAILNA